LGTATLSNGTATLPIGTGGLATGTDVITVAYSGDSNFPAASTTLNLVVQ
jgi:X-X-X-Leu-X-X-Gly heptad repeat protein